MFKRFLPVLLLTFFLTTLINWGCTKLDTTTLGSDLIPAVDNINTFADTLDIISTQGIFDDTLIIFNDDNHALGTINNDPVFGQTDAQVNLQLKPSFYPYYFGSPKDTLVGVDSVVLTLSYKGAWGDTNVLQQLAVFQINDKYFADSAYLKFPTTKYKPNLGAQIGAATVDIRTIKNQVKFNYGRDSVRNQIRIKLSAAFATQLFGRDSTSIAGNNAFLKDTLFRDFYNGFAIKGVGTGNALMYVNLTDANTGLEIYYRRKLNGTGKLDSTYNRFGLTTTSADITKITISATSNYIKRTLPSYINPASQDIYLQTGPGTFANLVIPGLNTFQNSIIHRASIYMEQIPEDPNSDSIFSAPPFMYLDLKDTGTTKWKPIYFDLNPNSRYDPDFKGGLPYYPFQFNIDYNYFGAAVKKRVNAIGQKVSYYDINVSRYVQQVVSKGTPNYQMRLFPAYNFSYPQYSLQVIPYNNPVAFGRIKVKGGSHPDKRLKMRLVIINSKI